MPDDILDDVAASLLMQGITAHHFVTEAADIQPGQAAVVHAAAGGLGQKLTQLIKARGGTVMGIVSNAQKADAARCADADHIVLSTGDAYVEPALDLSGGEGVHVVFDGGGETTLRASMSVLRRHGLLRYYGAVLGAASVINMRSCPAASRSPTRNSVTTSPPAGPSCATAQTSSTWYGRRTSTL